jgi:hypothetical protein
MPSTDPVNQMFSEKPDFKLSQWNRISENSNEWQEEILKLIHEKVPQRSGLKVKLFFQKMDEEKGYAAASAAIMDPRSGKQINIPIIIKAFHLAPLDVMIKDEVAMPFTAETIRESLFDPDVFSGTVPGGRKPDDVFYDDSLYSQTFPPIYGKYTYSAPFKVLNAISGTLGADDIERFRSLLDDDADTVRSFVKQGAIDLISGLTTETAAEDKRRAETTKKIFTIKKDGPNDYRLYGNADIVFDPAVYQTDRQNLVQFLQRAVTESPRVMDILNDVDRVGEHTTAPPLGDKPMEESSGKGVPSTLGDARKSPFMFNPLADAGVAKSADKYGLYGVKDKAGVFARGLVLPNVVDFEGKKVPIKIFVGQAVSAVQNRIAGVPLTNTQAQPERSALLGRSQPEPGKTGVFVVETKDNVVATIPIRISGITEYRGTLGIKGNDYKGRPINLVMVQGLSAMSKAPHSELLGPLTSKKEDNYYLPADMHFAELGNLRHVSESPEEFEKQAKADFLDAAPLRIIASNGRFVFKGPIEKYASDLFDFNALAPHEAKFLLVSWGCSPAKADTFLKEAAVLARADVHALQYTPTAAEAFGGHRKLASAIDVVIARVKMQAWPLTKFAADLKDADTVDKVLALNFVNPQNVQRFVGAIPQYREVISSLAKMLLASRMGMSDIPEDSVLSAMGQMQEVIKGLQKLRLVAPQPNAA